jgi:hypothetical protein
VFFLPPALLSLYFSRKCEAAAALNRADGDLTRAAIGLATFVFIHAIVLIPDVNFIFRGTFGSEGNTGIGNFLHESACRTNDYEERSTGTTCTEINAFGALYIGVGVFCVLFGIVMGLRGIGHSRLISSASTKLDAWIRICVILAVGALLAAAIIDVVALQGVSIFVAPERKALLTAAAFGLAIASTFGDSPILMSCTLVVATIGFCLVSWHLCNSLRCDM